MKTVEINLQKNGLWQRLLPFVVIAILVAAYWPTFIGLSVEWTQWDESLSHAYPLLIWFLILLYKVGPLGRTAQGVVIDSLLAIGLILVSIGWFLFSTIQIKILEQLILLPVLYLALAFAFGIKVVWQLRFLLLMPVFAIPVWDYLNTPLVELASAVVGEMVRWIRIPALIDGSSIFIPSGHIMIADGCSGLRYLIISLALGYTVSYLNGYREKGLIVSLVIAGSLGLLANWIRIFILILVGYYTEMQSSLMEDHEAFGWLVFALICFPAIYFAPVIKAMRAPVGTLGGRVSTPRMLLLVLLMTPGLWLGKWVSTGNIADLPQYNPVSVGFVQTTSNLPLAPLLPPPKSSQGFFMAGNIYLQINQYYPQSAGERLVPYIARQFDSQFWLLESSAVVAAGEKNVRVESLRQKSGLKRVVQVQWFDVGGKTTATVTRAKLLQVPAVLSGKQYFSVFTLQAECTQRDCQEVRQTLVRLSESIQ